MGRTAPPEIRILCFGASITCGFYAGGAHFHPYSIQLKARLQRSLPHTEFVIDVDGLSGDRLIDGEYISRLNRHCPKEGKTAYDWIIIQGGGNDLGMGQQPSHIYEALKKSWNIVLDAGAQVLALTVTETSDTSVPTRSRYDSLNAMVLNYWKDKFYVADVCAKIPYASMDKEMRKKVWDDGLHMKPAGYDMMGDAIADRLLEILQKPATSKI